MAQVKWTRPAIENLWEIEQFHARYDPLYAREVVEELFDTADQLATFPRMGHPASTKPEPNARELVKGAYLIKYHVIQGSRTTGDHGSANTGEGENLNEIVEILAVKPARAQR